MTRARWASIRLEYNSLGRILSQAPRGSSRARGVFRRPLSNRCTLIAIRVFVTCIPAHGSKVLQCPRQKTTTFSSRVLENLRWRRFLVVNRLDLIGGQIFVEEGLQAESSCWRVAGHQSKILAHPTPSQLLVRNSIVASVLYNVIEKLEQVDVIVA